MEAADIQFRTAALGGFSKQDVLDYIEKANQDHAAKVEGLQKELSAMTEERDKLKARVEEAEGRLVELYRSSPASWPSGVPLWSRAGASGSSRQRSKAPSRTSSPT